MSKSKKHGWLCRELLTCPICYTLVLTEKQFNTVMRKYDVPKSERGQFLNDNSSATTHFLTHPVNEPIAIVAVGNAHKKMDKKQVYALLVHEAVHIWQRAKRHIGEDYPGNETEAYAIQRISQSLMFEYEYLTK